MAVWREKSMKTIDFVKKRKIFFIISLSVIAVTLIVSLVFGVELDIQFKGGAMVQYTYTGSIDTAAVKTVAENATGFGVNVQTSVDTTGSETLVLSIPDSMDSDQQAKLTSAMEDSFSENEIALSQITNINPTIGSEFFKKCLMALLVASLLIILYVALRFRKIGGFSAGVIAVIMLFHDLIFIFGVFVLFRIPLNDCFIAACLTILGYSVNDTIVIYDRIRENRRLYGSKLSYAELVNKSVNQSVGRALSTTLTTEIALASICVISLVFQINSILTFALPLMVGMAAGVYSSVCVTGPLWCLWREYRLKKKQQS